MADEMQKTVNTFSKLHEAMMQTNQDANGLVKRFSDASSASNKLWTTMSRLTIGMGFRGFWRFQSLIRSVGNVFELWYDHGENILKQEKEMMDNTLGLYNAYEKIQDVKNNIAKTDDDAFKMMRLMMGEDKARAKLKETVARAEEVNAKKLARALGMSRKDVRKRLGTKIFGRQITGEQDPETREKLEGLKKVLPRNFGVFQPIFNFAKIGFRTFKAIPKKLWKGATGLIKLSTGLFRKLLIFTVQFMMYFVGIMLLLFALRKPLMAGFNYLKGLYEKWPEIKENLMTVLEPVWNAVKGFWDATMGVFNTLFDPNATIGDMLRSLGVFVVKGLKIVWEIGKVYFTKFLPLLISSVIKFGKVLWSYFRNVDWVGKAKEAGAAVKDMLIQYWNNNLKPWLLSKGLEPIANGIERAVKWLKDTWVKVEPYITKFVIFYKDAYAWLFNIYTTVIVPMIIDKIKSLYTIIKNFTEDLGFSFMAKGGTVNSSGNFIVGELGPEMVTLPAGAKVTPNHKLGLTNNASVNNITVNVNGRVGASDQELRDIAKKIGFMLNREINRATAMGVR
tara:strand:- start:2336 stop:4024 length:1689 start_codon:yes stop_codon:yes gene_type:complete